ncbi:acyl-CoA dehydrogenase family protein [Geomesophilobacter sediminis]|uniref:Cyclohex-1-ene-1-carbonyl-CoA dehydrogenase n=1 Tax=Geomesophilobacter sediminis TaxID=2798584 RepID=A0A8J7JFF1_9BACT|nr:acyl-CoA dehydrogenase family protein [Geomesophilobacter sediminis]MBJ6726216.1 acyl-CoA dehydrogenase family protein [Geomesophilobacter sediminis]
MDFELSQEQKLIRDTARAFAREHLEPVAARLDREGDRSAFLANLKSLAQLGFMGLNVPDGCGGAGAGVVAFALAITEIARACASTAVTVSVTNMVNEVILAVGSEEQKSRYLPLLCSGEYSAGAFALTEAAAGSDPSAMTTRAVRDQDGWLLNGSKVFITSAPYAGVFVVWAVTDPAAPKGKGISCFLVEAGTPGLIVGKEEHKTGQRGSATNEVLFQDCRIPEAALMGKLNDGFRVAVGELAGGRIGIAALALGVGLAAMNYATAYAAERVQFGQKIAAFEGVQWKIADAYTELEAARLLTLSAAARKEQGKPYAKQASMAKMFASEAANRACYSAVQILGGYGYLQDFPVERYARDARVTTIYEGTNEIQRVIVAREILKAFGSD